ncbi:MAG: hypothetical protein BWX70_03462 [Verrucomicrobia bacterium ADurb.Bin070]|nr:MAG: hypothetical protein BWX70_03462 [Verrucomicrobia bacterium ADurb.Bin070]
MSTLPLVVTACQNRPCGGTVPRLPCSGARKLRVSPSGIAAARGEPLGVAGSSESVPELETCAPAAALVPRTKPQLVAGSQNVSSARP